MVSGDADSYFKSPRMGVLKLRVSALRLLTCGETLGFIITRRVSEGFTETLPNTLKHNPSLTQRVGIDANAQLQNMGRGLVSLDWNNDGKEDLLFRNSDEASCLVENVTETSGQSLKFLLRGVNSERHCVGATLTAHFSDGQKLISTVYGGGS